MQLCMGRGFICEACNDSRPIFPFNIAEVRRCSGVWLHPQHALVLSSARVIKYIIECQSNDDVTAATVCRLWQSISCGVLPARIVPEVHSTDNNDKQVSNLCKQP